MAFDQVIGQNRIKQILASALESKRLAHAYLFHGPPGVGKDAMAIRMAMGLNCSNNEPQGCGTCAHCIQTMKLEHPGFKMVLPLPTRPKSMKAENYNELVLEKNLERIENPYREISFTPAITALPGIGIEQIRSLKQEVILKQQQDQYRIFIISHADQMTVPAANSLLKLLEEPPNNTVLILTTSAPARILPTISSRCQNVRFDALSDTDVKQALMERWQFNEDKASFFSRMASGSMQRALALADENFDSLRTAAWTFLENAVQSNHLKRMADCDKLIQDLDKAGLQAMLELLLAWLRDLLCLQSGLPEKLINLDQKTKLTDFFHQHASLDLESALSDTEHAIASIKKNVYLNLVLHTLSQKLNRLAV